MTIYSSNEKKKTLFYTIIFASFSLAVSLSMIPPYYQQNIEAQETDTTNKEKKDNCITYNSSENLISITCKNTSFADISSSSQLQDAGILIQQQQPSLSTTNINNNEEKIWLLYAGIKVEKDASLNIDSKDVTWLKIVPSENSPNAIEADGSLKVDSVKITSWDPETDDYVKFPKEAKNEEEIYASILRPYIKVNSDATGPTIIKNSELAYLGYDCAGCGGVTFNGGENSILKNNDIHHIHKGFYSKGMGYMLIEGNRVYGNEKYGIIPHTGTHDMIIKNNTVYNNYNAGIICSLDCYNIIIEENKVYNNGPNQDQCSELALNKWALDNCKGGIGISRNTHDSIIRNNIVYNEDKCIQIGRDSYNNKVYDNVLSNCLNGIKVTTSSFNNEIYNNKIENVDYALYADEAATNNVFHSNTVIDAKIDLAFEDKKTSKGNTFNNNNNNKVSFDTLEKVNKDDDEQKIN